MTYAISQNLQDLDVMDLNDFHPRPTRSKDWPHCQVLWDEARVLLKTMETLDYRTSRDMEGIPAVRGIREKLYGVLRYAPFNRVNDGPEHATLKVMAWAQGLFFPCNRSVYRSEWQESIDKDGTTPLLDSEAIIGVFTTLQEYMSNEGMEFRVDRFPFSINKYIGRYSEKEKCLYNICSKQIGASVSRSQTTPYKAIALYCNILVTTHNEMARACGDKEIVFDKVFPEKLLKKLGDELKANIPSTILEQFDTPEEIEKVYRNSDSGSCMRHPGEKFHELSSDEHPTHFYGNEVDNNFVLLAVRQKNKDSWDARAVGNRKTRQWGRVFGDADLLKRVMSHEMPEWRQAPSTTPLEGLRFKVEIQSLGGDKEFFIAPYIDAAMNSGNAAYLKPVEDLTEGNTDYKIVEVNVEEEGWGTDDCHNSGGIFISGGAPGTVWSAYHERDIPEEDAGWSGLLESEVDIHSDEIRYSEYMSDYISINSESIVWSDRSGDYLPVEDCVYVESEDGYVLQDEEELEYSEILEEWVMRDNFEVHFLENLSQYVTEEWVDYKNFSNRRSGKELHLGECVNTSDTVLAMVENPDRLTEASCYSLGYLGIGEEVETAYICVAGDDYAFPVATVDTVPGFFDEEVPIERIAEICSGEEVLLWIQHPCFTSWHTLEEVEELVKEFPSLITGKEVHIAETPDIRETLPVSFSEAE